MRVGGSQKPSAKWWQSISADRSWLSLASSKSARQSVSEAGTIARAKRSRSPVKG